MKKNHKNEILMLFFVVITGIFFLFGNKNLMNISNNSETSFKKITNVSLVAKSAYVMETETGREIYNKKANFERPIASITKIMTAMIASDILDGDQYIKITKDSIKTAGDYGFDIDEEFKTNDLIAFMLVGSANDAAVAIEDVVRSELGGVDFNDVMNEKAKLLVLKNTYFYNSSGLDREEFVGSYSTAYDIAQMMTYAYKNYSIIDITKSPLISAVSKEGIIHKIENTNDLLKDERYASRILASKTGYTDNSGGSLVVILKAMNQKLYTIVILGSTYFDRFDDMEKLIKEVDYLE